MRLLNVAQSYPSADPTNSGAIHVHRQWLALQARGWDVRVITPQVFLYRTFTHEAQDYPAYGLKDGIPVWRPRFVWPEKLISRRSALFETRYATAVDRISAKVTADWTPDVVACDWITPGGTGAARLARRFGVPLILKAHGQDVRQIARAVGRFRAAVAAVSAASTRVVCNGMGLYNSLLESGLFPEEKLIQIPIGVDTRLFIPASPVVRAATRGRLGLPMDAQVWLFVGRWEVAKGSREMLAALSTILPRFPNVHFAAIGLGRDMESQDALQALGAQVHFYGEVRPEEVREYVQASDLFLLPSHQEGLPTALLETMACGLPAVITSVGGIPTVVRDGQTGFLLPPKDIPGPDRRAGTLCSRSRPGAPHGRPGPPGLYGRRLQPGQGRPGPG